MVGWGRVYQIFGLFCRWFVNPPLQDFGIFFCLNIDGILWFVGAGSQIIYGKNE